MFFAKFDLALAPSSPLSTNILLFFFNWGGGLEHFCITGKYTEYSGYIFLRAGGWDRVLLRGSGKSQDISFSFFTGSFGECQPSEVKSACSESKTFAKVVLQTVQLSSMC